MIDRRRLLAVAATLTTSLACGASADTPSGRLDRPGIVVALRHASAPGVGDLPDFVLDNCTTQRNLDAGGRTQARAIGEGLRAARLGTAKVYSSRWCRCLETAELLGLGPASPLAALDSFFGQRALRVSRTAALRAFLAEQGANGPPLVLVTHQVNITAITGRGTRSGEGVVLQRRADCSLEELATIDPPSM